MTPSTPTPTAAGRLARAAVCLALVALTGCATLLFRPRREARFINMDAEILRCEYGVEKRTETLPNGLVCTFDGKIRLTLPDGTRLVLYQALATSGMRYLSADKRVELREKGPYCQVTRDGAVVFEGVYCRDR